MTNSEVKRERYIIKNVSSNKNISRKVDKKKLGCKGNYGKNFDKRNLKEATKLNDMSSN